MRSCGRRNSRRVPQAFAAVTPLEMRIIAAGLSPAVPGTLTMGALKSPRILQPVHARFSILSPVLAVGSSRRSCTGRFTRLFAVAAKRLQSGCPDTPTC